MTWKQSPISDRPGWGRRRPPQWLGGLCLAAVVALATVAGPRDSQAAPPSNPKAAARKKLVEGAELLKKGDFQAALDRFQAAYDLVPSPKIHYNFALAYMGLGRNAEAMQALLTFLGEASDASADTISNARKYKESLVPKICRVTLHADVAGAGITVDGHSYGTTPRGDEVLLDPGLHSLVVEKPGTGKAYTQWFEAPAGKSLTIEAKLLPPKPAKPATRRTPIAMEATTDTKTSGGVKTNALADLLATPSPASSSGGRWMKWSGIAVGSLAAVALGFGTFEWVVKEQKFIKFNDDGCDKKYVADFGGPNCRPLFNDGDRAKRLGYIGFAAAGALGIGSAVLLLLGGQGSEPPAKGPEPPAKPEKIFACAPTLGAAGGSCTLRF